MEEGPVPGEVVVEEGEEAVRYRGASPRSKAQLKTRLLKVSHFPDISIPMHVISAAYRPYM